MCFTLCHGVLSQGVPWDQQTWPLCSVERTPSTASPSTSCATSCERRRCGHSTRRRCYGYEPKRWRRRRRRSCRCWSRRNSDCWRKGRGARRRSWSVWLRRRRQYWRNRTSIRCVLVVMPLLWWNFSHTEPLSVCLFFFLSPSVFLSMSLSLSVSLFLSFSLFLSPSLSLCLSLSHSLSLTLSFLSLHSLPHLSLPSVLLCCFYFNFLFIPDFQLIFSVLFWSFCLSFLSSTSRLLFLASCLLFAFSHLRLVWLAGRLTGQTLLCWTVHTNFFSTRFLYTYSACSHHWHYHCIPLSVVLHWWN